MNAEFKDMSLFNQTVARVTELESQLKEREGRIANLEIALKTALRDKRNLMEGRFGRNYGTLADRPNLPKHEMNTLSAEDSETQMSSLEQDAEDDRIDAEVARYQREMLQEARMAEGVDAADLKFAANKGVSVRGRLLAPALKFCALFIHKRSYAADDSQEKK